MTQKHRLLLILLLSLLVASIVADLSFPFVSGQSTVTQTAITVGTARANQRKSFYGNGSFWMFYSDGVNMAYRSSTDGASWSAPTVVRAATTGYSFSIWFDGVYMYYAYCDWALASLRYRRGSPNVDGSITWSAAEQIVYTTWNTTYIPFVSVDSAGFVWIGYTDLEPGPLTHPYVIKSGNNDGTWGVTPAPFPYLLNAATDRGTWGISVLPLTATRMYVVYASFVSMTQGGYPILGRRWSGAAMGGEEQASISGINEPQYYSAVADVNENVYMAFLTDAGRNIVHVERTNLTSHWENEVIINVGMNYSCSPALSIDAFTGKLYCFWGTRTTGYPPGATANHIYYQKSSDGGVSWSTMVDWIDESVQLLNWEASLTCFYQAYDSKIGLAYETRSASPYNVRFAFIVCPRETFEGLYESCTTGDTSIGTVYGAQWVSQGFQTTIAHNVSSIWLKMYRYGYPGIMTVKLQGSTAAGLPNGTTVWLGGRNASEFTNVAPGAWYNFSDSPPTQLLPATNYTIVVCVEGYQVGWRLAIPGTYPGGHLGVSTDNGYSWTDGPGAIYAQWDALFEIWGDDIVSPLYTNGNHSTTWAGYACQFSVNVSDNGVLNQGIFSTNNTGAWVNETAYIFTANPSWCNATKTLNVTIGNIVQYRWYLNDVSYNWNTTTIFSLTITPGPFWYVVYGTNATDAGAICQFTCYWMDGLGLSGFIFSTNNTGAWINDTWTAMAGLGDWANATHVLNSTIGVDVAYLWYANNTLGNWNTTLTYTVLTTDPALGAPVVPPWSIPYYYPLLGKCLDLIGCLGAVALVFANTKSMKDGLKAAVITLLIAIVFIVVWFIMTSLEAYA